MSRDPHSTKDKLASATNVGLDLGLNTDPPALTALGETTSAPPSFRRVSERNDYPESVDDARDFISRLPMAQRCSVPSFVFPSDYVDSDPNQDF